eukprot:309382-Prorocentrum_minimum.AAC.3
MHKVVVASNTMHKSFRGLPECSYASFAISPMPTKLLRDSSRELKQNDRGLSSISCHPSPPVPTRLREEQEVSSYAAETAHTRQCWEGASRYPFFSVTFLSNFLRKRKNVASAEGAQLPVLKLPRVVPPIFESRTPGFPQAACYQFRHGINVNMGTKSEHIHAI